MLPSFPPRLAGLVQLWRSRVGAAQGQVWVMLLVAAVLVGAHVARLGTLGARASVAGGLGTLLLLWIVRVLWMRRLWRNAQAATRRVVGEVDRELAKRTERALRLVERTSKETDPVSRELAALHLDSLLMRVGLERLEERATHKARLFMLLTATLFVTALAMIVLGPLRLMEGLDVLVARGGRAPVPIQWIDQVLGEVQVPRYLRQEGGAFSGFVRTRAPRGSVLVLHAAPVHADRQLVLTDGKTEVGFVDDAHGALVARWTLTDSAKLEIAARFGAVLIVQREGIELESMADEAPRVEVEGAPLTVHLLDTSEILVKYEVAEDHGLTQIDLVLRSGQREDRRALAKLDGQEVFERGSAVVRPNDRFLKQALAPVQITVEARDNDPITGPKWGRSQPITVIPPAVGEAEVRRYQALKAVFESAIDLLAKRLEYEISKESQARSEHANQEVADHKKLQESANQAFAAVYGGLKIPKAFAVLVNGRLDRIASAGEAERKTQSLEQSRAAHDKTTRATEEAILAFDSALQLLSTVDASSSARRLAEVAEEAAEGAKQAQGAERDRGFPRLEASKKVLQASSDWILKLGRLGKDLGEVVGIGVRRIQRSQEAGKLDQAELAARDLALRLKSARPSFSGGGGRRSTETGGLAEQGGEPGEGMSQVEDQRQEIDKIAKEHGDEMKQLEEELAKAMRGNDEELRKQSREHAKAVRDAVRPLPSAAADSNTAEGAAAMARENAHSMADALESGNLPEAVARGRNALRAAEQARKLAGKQQDFFGDPLDLGDKLEQAKGKLEREQRWAEQQLENLRKSRAEKARGAIERSANAEERLARRTGEAARAGRSSEAPMPKAMQDLLEGAEKAMRESHKSLKGGELERGTDSQKEAQRMLEMAREIQGSNESTRERTGEEEGERGEVGGPVDIPKAQDFRGPEAFRKRVLEGLGKSSDPRLRDAVRRYAEGLLR